MISMCPIARITSSRPLIRVKYHIQRSKPGSAGAWRGGARRVAAQRVALDRPDLPSDRHQRPFHGAYGVIMIRPSGIIATIVPTMTA